MSTTNIKLEPEVNKKNIDTYGYSHKKETDFFTVEVFIDYINKRLKVNSFKADDFDKLVDYLISLACKKDLSKILFIAEENTWKELFVRGFFLEALHPSFFKGQPGFHMSKFLSQERRISTLWEKEDEILKKVLESSPNKKESLNYKVMSATEKDIPLLVDLYSKVFETYPTPLSNADYLKEIINNDALFKIIFDKEKIISAASLYIDKNTLSAEITDCATLKEYRGKGLMFFLIPYLEYEAKKRGIITLYTIARAISPGINKVFARHQYKYYGRFIKNCDISGSFEDMNLWSKIIL